jgi:hypothetical protein
VSAGDRLSHLEAAIASVQMASFRLGQAHTYEAESMAVTQAVWALDKAHGWIQDAMTEERGRQVLQGEVGNG